SEGIKPDELQPVELELSSNKAGLKVDAGFVNDVGQISLKALERSGRKRGSKGNKAGSGGGRPQQGKRPQQAAERQNKPKDAQQKPAQAKGQAARPQDGNRPPK